MGILYPQVSFTDGVTLDALSRLRVSTPYVHFEGQMQYDLVPDLFDSEVTGNGTITHLPNESAARLRVTTASGDKVIRQSLYNRYQPGIGQLVYVTGVLGTLKTNVRQRIGIFDDSNGIFFEQDGINLKIVRRTKASGSVVDNVANQNTWNIDPMHGNGPSRSTIDTSKTQLFFIDYEWLGVGRIRCGVVVDGVYRICHEFYNSNRLDTVYMSTPNLPIRYEIENTDGTASNTDMLQICSAVIGEGGTFKRGVLHAIDSGTTGKSLANGVLTPALSIRPKTLFNGISNTGLYYILDVDLLVTGNTPIRYSLVKNASVLTASSWQDHPDIDSAMQYDIAASAITGGILKQRGFVNAGSKGQKETRENTDLLMRIHVDGTHDRYTLTTTALGGSATVYVALNWRELY
jgi:hypothetical protein